MSTKSLLDDVNCKYAKLKDENENLASIISILDMSNNYNKVDILSCVNETNNVDVTESDDKSSKCFTARGHKRFSFGGKEWVLNSGCAPIT